MTGKYRRVWFLIIVVFFSLSANSHATIKNLQNKSAELSLANNKSWLDLLHYKTDQSSSESYIDDAQFFLSDQGKVDPQAELFATIQLLIEHPEKQCLFVGRVKWLIKNLEGFGQVLPIVNCPEYQTWRDHVNAQSITLVLASSYLNSPSSMYGHTFLRFDQKNLGEEVPLLSSALNFGAVIDSQDNGFFYAFKGLMGGYPGYFTDGPYYRKIKEYSRLDNRDIWEYTLNLTPDEIDMMLAHLWELNQIRFDYFFFDENCSFRLLELLEVARPSASLVSEFPVFALPIDTVRTVKNSGLIASIHYRPSVQTNLEFAIEQLSEKEKKIALQIIDDVEFLHSSEFIALDKSSQYRICQVAYRNIRFYSDKNLRDEKTANQSLLLLKKINDLADYSFSASSSNERPPTPPRPELGHETALLSFAEGFEKKQGHEKYRYTDVEFKASYHDLLDNLSGYPEYTSLNMGKFAVRFKENETAQIQLLDLVEISSFGKRSDFFNPLSWRIRTGLERQSTQSNDELVTHFTGGLGLTYSLFSDVNVFSLVHGRLENNAQFQHEIEFASGAALGFFSQNKNYSWFVQLEHSRFLNDEERNQFQFSYQLPLAINHALRFNFKRDINGNDFINDGNLSYRYYF